MAAAHAGGHGGVAIVEHLRSDELRKLPGKDSTLNFFNLEVQKLTSP